MYARLRCGGNLPLCLAFGTGEGLLRYGICVPCSKRLPGVRDAFSEAFGVKNRLLRYGRDIRYQKQPSVVRDAFSEAYRAKSSTCRTGRIFSARNGPRSEVIRLKRGRPLSLSRLFGQSLTSMVLSGVRRLLIACL